MSHSGSLRSFRSSSHTISLKRAVSLFLAAGTVLALQSAASPVIRPSQIIMPIRQSLSVSSINASSGSFTVTIDIEHAPTETGYIQVGCSQTGIVSSPSTVWPYHLNWSPSDPLSKTFTLTFSGATSSTTVQIYACQSDLDITNSANWQVLNSLTVGPKDPG